MLSLGDHDIEVIEDFGETDRPLRVFYRVLPDDAFPIAWDAGYPVGFRVKIVVDGLRVGYPRFAGASRRIGIQDSLVTSVTVSVLLRPPRLAL